MDYPRRAAHCICFSRIFEAQTTAPNQFLNQKDTSMKSPQFKPVYSAADFESLGFHDCYVYGIRWISSSYSLIIDLDYIVQWLETNGSYNFWVAPSELRFDYASEVKISLDWTKLPMDCQVQDVHRHDRKATPNGSNSYHWEIEFVRPYGSIDLWATDFRLSLQATPILSPAQHLR